MRLSRTRGRRSCGTLPALVLVSLCAGATVSEAQRFRSDDPVLVDPDHLPIPKPSEIELSTSFDALYHSFGDRGRGKGVPAENVNTLGEVPDSSWFINRIGVRDMSIEELVRGPDTVDGPDGSGPWTVIAGKSSGITPGFTIRDARGDVYFLKFDPIPYPHLSTAADVIVTKFFHAFGYHVPENYLAYFDPAQLRVSPDARLSRGAKKRPMVQADVDVILEHVPREPDGRIRVAASRALPGEPIGSRLFFGTRADDANDIFRHEDRRDLRGYRVFCAWLNHDDSRAINTLDVYLPEEDGGFVRHYLIDFSSTLGSGSDATRRIAPQSRRAGNEYVIEWSPVFKTLFGLGLWQRPWRGVEYRVYPEIGRIESSFFRPDRWKPEYPNPAFRRMQPQDAFWATRIVARFSDEAIRALVHTGEFSDAEAERFLADTIIQRRDKVLDHYLRQLNPLDGFRVEPAAGGSSLEFEHLGQKHRLGAVTGYEHQWFVFDNEADATTPLGEPTRSAEASIPVPAADHPFVMVRIRSESADEPRWQQPVDVYLRRAGDAWTLVGLERHADTVDASGE